MSAHFVQQLDRLRRRSLRMASLVEDIVQEACEAVFSGDERLANRVVRRDDEVDAEEVEVESEVIRMMALYQPVGSDLRLLCTMLKVNNDLERIADCAVNIVERTRDSSVKDLARNSDSLHELAAGVEGLLRRAVQTYGEADPDLAITVFTEEKRVDELYRRIIRSFVAEVTESVEQVCPQLDVLFIAKNLERIADHATNIAEDVVYLSTGRIVRHHKVETEVGDG
jgi:phosphate transport system protein